jgi:hypothetical protein
VKRQSNSDLEKLNGFELQHLARATGNAGFFEEYRARNCRTRCDAVVTEDDYE